MKFSVDRDVLEDAVSWATRTLPTRPAIPVLSGVRIVAGQEAVEISSFDYEVSSKTQFPAEVASEGEVLVSGKMVANICKQLPKQTVVFELTEDKVRISCGNSRFELMAMMKDDYPALPVLPDPVGSLSTSAFSRAVSQVAVASSRDDALPLLATVNMEIKGNKLVLMATDRYRLAMSTLDWHPNDPDIEVSCLIKAKIISDMAKALPLGSEIDLSLSSEPGTSSLFGIESSGRVMTSQLTDGDYPPVATLFPAESPIQVTVEQEELLQALRRVSLVAEHGTVVRLKFTPGTLQLDAGEGDDAHAFEQIPCDITGEDELQVSFNPRYLIDGVQALEADTVRLEFTHPTKPVVISGVGREDSSDTYKYLLMPIR